MTTGAYFDIFESIPLGVVVIDLNGHIQTMNGFARTILNIPDTPIENDHIALLAPFPVGALPKDDPAGETGEVKIRYNDKILALTMARLRGERSEPPRAVIALRDVTETEKNQATEKNHKKRTLISELSADIAHEIRNPLGSIELLASLLKKESKRDKDVNRANQIMAAVNHVEKAIAGLIDRGSKDRLEIAHVNIHDLLKEILLFSESIIDGGAVFLSARYADVEPVVECNADMMKQVFLHLILNALPGDGRLDIMTCYDEERHAIEIHFIEKKGSASQNSQFGIFRRLLHGKDDHWGLGLAIVHNVVNTYNGGLRFEYREEAGASFVLSFPLRPLRKPEPDAIDEPFETRKDTNEEK
jgi:nitrogen-specific signal transduction histidine kinase